MQSQSKPLPSQEELLNLFQYSPETGEFLWKKSGREAGSLTGLDRTRYRQVQFKGRVMLVHRIVWKMMTGYDPEVIDHINGDGTDNRWKNLRSVTIAQNTLNRSLNKNNKSGVSGVIKVGQRWKACIAVNRKRIHLGYFSTFGEAVEVRKAAEAKYGYFDRSNVSAQKNLTE